MKKIKAKILELSDMIHKDDMEYSIYTREEFIKELNRNVTSFFAAELYLEAMSKECDKLFDEKEDSSYLSIKEDIRLFLYTIWEYALKDTIWEDALKEEKEKFWREGETKLTVNELTKTLKAKGYKMAEYTLRKSNITYTDYIKDEKLAISTKRVKGEEETKVAFINKHFEKEFKQMGIEVGTILR